MRIKVLKKYEEANKYCDKNCKNNSDTVILKWAAYVALLNCMGACLEPWAEGKQDDPTAGSDAFDKFFDKAKERCPEKKSK